MFGRITIVMMLLLLHTAAFASNELTFVTYHERDYVQGPLKAYAEIDQHGRKLLVPHLHSELFGSENGVLERIFELLKEDKPDIYKNARLRLSAAEVNQPVLWDTLEVRLDNVSEEEFATIRNEVVYSFGIHGDNKFVKFFLKDGREEVYSIYDVDVPVFKLWLPEEDTTDIDTLKQADTLQQDTLARQADKHTTMEEDIENWRTWFFIALGACIFMLIVIIILTLRLR